MNETWQQKFAGRLVVIDGPDGAGKSTQVNLLAEALRAGRAEVTSVRDPGGTPIGDRIREILLDRRHEEMAVECETLLYMASRAQLVAQVIRPALEAGRCVLSDRFVSSTIAYQGAGGGDAAQIAALGAFATGGLRPDLTIVLDLSAETGLARSTRRGALDRMESKSLAFHQAVRRGFLDQAQAAPERFAVLDATPEPGAVAASIIELLKGRTLG